MSMDNNMFLVNPLRSVSYWKLMDLQVKLHDVINDMGHNPKGYTRNFWTETVTWSHCFSSKMGCVKLYNNLCVRNTTQNDISKEDTFIILWVFVLAYFIVLWSSSTNMENPLFHFAKTQYNSRKKFDEHAELLVE